MSDLRSDLERKSEHFELAPGGIDRLFERRRRKQRNLRIRAGVLAIVIASAGTWGAVSALRDLGTRQPATSPTPSVDRELYALIAGTYTVTLRDDDPVVRANGLAGTTTMRLRPNGVLELSLPPGFQVEGASPSGISFEMSGNRFTTNAFVSGVTCAKTIGQYRWELRNGRLMLIPLQEPCEVRRALFGSRPWERVP